MTKSICSLFPKSDFLPKSPSTCLSILFNWAYFVIISCFVLLQINVLIFLLLKYLRVGMTSGKMGLAKIPSIFFDSKVFATSWLFGWSGKINSSWLAKSSPVVSKYLFLASLFEILYLSVISFTPNSVKKGIVFAMVPSKSKITVLTLLLMSESFFRK